MDIGYLNGIEELHLAGKGGKRRKGHSRRRGCVQVGFSQSSFELALSCACTFMEAKMLLKSVHQIDALVMFDFKRFYLDSE